MIFVIREVLKERERKKEKRKGKNEEGRKKKRERRKERGKGKQKGKENYWNTTVLKTFPWSITKEKLHFNAYSKLCAC